MRVLVALTLVVGASAFNCRPAAGQGEKPPVRPFPVVENDAAWTKLPRENPPLPPWARALAGPLPKTAARMLELDHLQRAKNPLGAELAGRIHWAVADAIGSAFGKATAEGDLKRAKVPGPADQAVLAPAVRTAVAFARKLTTEGFAITDGEFAEVLRLYGAEKTTAIVHTVAFANFHNRIILGLGADGDPVPPVDVAFDYERFSKVSPVIRPPWDDLKAVTAGGLSVRADWRKATPDELNRTLDKQKERALRVPLPEAARLAGLPPRERDMANRVLWNTVSSGYQPEMTHAWFACLSAFYEESKVDRVFTNSMFWVVTRTNDCFY